MVIGIAELVVARWYSFAWSAFLNRRQNTCWTMCSGAVMPFIERNGKLYAKCDACWHQSRYPRKNDEDVPRGWGGSKKYLRCITCDQECGDAESEQQAAAWWL
jgi:hypothetical protein